MKPDTVTILSISIVIRSFQQEDVSVQLEALDILGDLLTRYGGKRTAELNFFSRI